MAKSVFAFLAMGMALVSAQQLPQVPQHTDPAVLNYNPFVNPNVPAHLQQQNPHHQASVPNVPQHTDPKVLNYNPFHNPNVHPNSIHHQPAPVAPTHHSASGYNPFHNPHVPAHLYQQQPQHHAPAPPTPPPAPQHYNNAPAKVPQLPQVPQHTDPAVTNYNPFYNPDTAGFNPFVNPNVPSHLYENAPRSQQNYQAAPQHHAPAPAAPQQPQYPGAFGPAGTFGFNSHPNAIPQGNNYSKGGRGPVKVSVSQQPQGFTYNFETS